MVATVSPPLLQGNIWSTCKETEESLAGDAPHKRQAKLSRFITRWRSLHDGFLPVLRRSLSSFAIGAFIGSGIDGSCSSIFSLFATSTKHSNALRQEPNRLVYVAAEYCENGGWKSACFGCLPTCYHILAIFWKSCSSVTGPFHPDGSNFAFPSAEDQLPNALRSVSSEKRP